MSNINKWDIRFLKKAEELSTWSKDPSTQVGCVVVEQEHRTVVVEGYNGFPRKVADDARLYNREEKYPIIVHAEENAIACAARVGVKVAGCTLYSTLFPCVRCARLVIQAGVTSVVAPGAWPTRWDQDIQCSIKLLEEAGLGLRFL